MVLFSPNSGAVMSESRFSGVRNVQIQVIGTALFVANWCSSGWGGHVLSLAASVSSTTAPSRSYLIPRTSSHSNPPQSLYTALLGPPPLKQAGTVHNSADPPVRAPSRSIAESRVRSGHRGTESAHIVRSIAESARAQSRGPKGRGFSCQSKEWQGKTEIVRRGGSRCGEEGCDHAHVPSPITSVNC